MFIRYLTFGSTAIKKMESFWRFYISLCLLAIACYALNVSGNVQFSRYIPLDNYTCSSATTIFTNVSATNSLACAMIGALYTGCYGVFFDQVTRECKGCSADFDEMPKVHTASVYYARNSSYHMMKFANGLYNNKKCDQSTSVFHDLYITSYQHCAKVCANNAECYSFFYQPGTQECRGCEVEYGVLNNNPVLGEWEGSMYFGKFRYLGCFYNYPRILENEHTSSSDMTTEQCVGRCITGGYLYALTEHQGWCQCGNELKPHSILSEELCNMNCLGNANQNCGAGWIGSLYIIQYW